MESATLQTPAPNPAVAAESPLNPGQLAELTRADQQSRKIRRAQRIAATDAWLMAIFASLTLLTGIFSLPTLLLGLAMALVAFNSFAGLRGLRRCDPAAPRRLGINQLLLAGAIAAYALYGMADATRHPHLLTQYTSSEPELAGLLEPYEHLAGVLTLIVYSAVIVITALAQGLTALYYFSREKHLRAYLASTPHWVLEVQATTSPA